VLVIKKDGNVVSFDTSKVRNWVIWGVREIKDISTRIGMEYTILTETLSRLPERVTTEEIHQTMIKVCLDKEEMEYSRVASKLELASIYKNQEKLLGLYKPQTASFHEVLDIMETKGLWKGEWLQDEKLYQDTVNEWLIELEAFDLEFWTVKQWSDKYSLRVDGEAVETPAIGCLAIAIAYHGVTELAFNVAKDLIVAKLNLPTPALNGCRNGNFNSISCCLMESGDNTESVDVAEYIASQMTSKKAGIGITLDTRSKGDPVRGGEVTHLGKQPLYKAIEAAVKKYTQITRGGSATMTFKCIDPDLIEMLLWKTQKCSLATRVDKIDYNFAYNDAFAKAVLLDEDWYLFSKYWAPEVHDNFHSENYEDYVRAALKSNVPHTKVKAMDIVKSFGGSRGETGRMYCINLTTTNRHTPFIDPIHQSNLCLEIALPTKPYPDMADLLNPTSEGETAFCSLAAANVANIEDHELFAFYERALRTVDKMIDKAPMMNASMRESLLRRRSIGIGITGLASKLYKAGLDYDGSPESLEMVEHTAELHMFALYKASIKMAKEDGIHVTGIKDEWLPIDTMSSTREPTMDWESIRGLPRKHSVLVAHMPTESSAVFSNATNGVYPSRSRVVYKKARKGKVQFISEYFTPDKLTAWEADLIPYYAAIQSYTDQAISADYFEDFTVLPNRKVQEVDNIEWFLTQSYRGVKTAYYNNYLDTKGEVEQEESCEGGGCKL
jgi:ribonucleoside-diphosphate reductase alpha chain